MQSRRQSLKEAAANTVVGGAINWLIVFGCTKLIANAAMAATAAVILCTVHSFVRGYFIRRTFAKKEAR